MILNPTRSNIPHVCVTSIHESQISLRFAVRRAIFEMQAILRTVHRMTPNDLEHYQLKCTKYMLLD